MTTGAGQPDRNRDRGPVRLAIAGLGLVGKRHARAISQVADAELVAVAEPGEDGLASARQLGVTHYTDLSDLLVAEKPDGIILATPTKLHVAQGLTCIAAGIPVLIEKPLADEMEGAQALVAAAERAGVDVLVGHHRRHNPLIRQAKALIDDGKIGQIRAVQATCWFYKPDEYFEVAPWRKRRGAGPVSVNLVHDIDLLRHLCGEIISVQAQAAPSRRGFENEDVAAAVLTFENGVIGTITVSDSIVAPWSWEMTSREYPVYPATHESCYMIGGSRGSLSVPDLSLWSHQDKCDWWTPISATTHPCENSDPLVVQIEHYLAVISGRETPIVSGREGLRTLAVIDAIQRAVQSQQTVRLGRESGQEPEPAEDAKQADGASAGRSKPLDNVNY